MNRIFLSGNDKIIMKHILLRVIFNFWKMLRLFVALITTPPLRNTYINAFKLTSLKTYVAANKRCIGLLKAYVFVRPVGGVLCSWSCAPEF